MPYVDRQNRICGFLDIEDNEACGRFLRRYFILDTKANFLLWYMDNPQNLPDGTGAVGSLQLTYISKVGVATAKQKPKAQFCFVINALSQRYFLQASDQKDLHEWVEALNRASRITVPKGGSLPLPEVTCDVPQEKKQQIAYKTEIIGGVVVQTPINPNDGEGQEGSDPVPHTSLRRSMSYVPMPVNRSVAGLPILKSGYCVKQGNVRKNWKRRYFVLDDYSISYFKCEKDREPLRSILLRDVQKTHECLVKSGDLLTRDNLFEIITSSRIFYIQADSPGDMHSWIKAISAAVHSLKMCYREFAPFSRSLSLNRRGISNRPSVSNPSISTAKKPEEKKSFVKGPSEAMSWQPWTPVPQAEKKDPAVEAGPEHSKGSATLAKVPDDVKAQGTRLRHVSEPQRGRETPYMISMDDTNIRTSDV